MDIIKVGTCGLNYNLIGGNVIAEGQRLLSSKKRMVVHTFQKVLMAPI